MVGGLQFFENEIFFSSRDKGVDVGETETHVRVISEFRPELRVDFLFVVNCFVSHAEEDCSFFLFWKEHHTNFCSV